MKTITAYKTSDGRVFEIESEAKVHEGKMEFEKRLNRFLVSNDICRSNISSGEVLNLISENREELLKILKGE